MDPEEIENRQFLVSLRGYARDEVETFREEVAQEIKILRKQLTKANSELSYANTELANVKAQLAEAGAQLAAERNKPAAAPEPQAPEPAPAEDRASVFRMVGQETERILLAAEQAADQIHERAVAESAALMADARTKVEQSLAEFEAARRAAEEDFAGIRDSRAMVASQLEDIRRRLEETIGRLRVPVELPGSKPVSRFRQAEMSDRGAGAPQAPIDRRLAGAQAQQRQQREMEAVRELQARQTAHRGEADRREEELKAVQAEAEQRARADAERQARDRAAAEAASAKKAQQAAELQAAVSAAQEAERLKNAREVERQKASEDASAAVKARADEQAAAAARQKAETDKAEEAAKAKADAERLERQQAEAEKLKAEADRVARTAADADAAAGAAEAEKVQPGKETAHARPDGGSSLDELLAEIRRKREEEEHQTAQKVPAAAQAATAVKVAPAPTAAPAPAAKDGALAGRSEALGDLPAQTARRLKRLLQEDHNDLLDRLRTQRGKGPLEDNLAPQNEQIRRFAAGLKEALGRAFAEGRKAAGGSTEADPLPAVTKLVTRQVVTPLRTEVSNAIAAGLEAEDSASALSERANDVFRVWKGVRTQLLGEGIAYSAYHQGLLDVWRTKAGSTKQWVFSDEESECPNDICRRNADAGEIATKEPFPSGHIAPPAHGGCTCTLRGS